MTIARYVYVVLAWALVVGIVAQVLLIGIGLFDDPSAMTLHRDFGYAVHLFPILVLGSALAARAGRRALLGVLGMGVLVFAVPLVIFVRGSMPVVAALHPVLALLGFGAAVGVAFSATRLARSRPASATGS